MAESTTTPSQKAAGDVTPGTAAASAATPAPAKTHAAAKKPAAASAAIAVVETAAPTKAMSVLSPLGGASIGETVGSTPSPPPLTDPAAQKPAVTAAPVIPAEKPNARRSAAKHARPDAAEIEQMIAEAAYYLAEKRNFAPGFAEADWSAATAEVMERLQQRENLDSANGVGTTIVAPPEWARNGFWRFSQFGDFS